MVQFPRSADVLWANLSALMEKHWQGENLTRLAREAKIGPGSATRLKNRQEGTGIDLVGRVAAVFGLQAWQLLMPGLDPSNPPVSSLTGPEAALYKRLRRAFDLMQDFTKTDP